MYKQQLLWTGAEQEASITNRTKLGFLIGCALMLFLALPLSLSRELRPLPSVALVFDDNLGSLLSGEMLSDKRKQDGRLLVDGQPVPYDAVSNTYYLPQLLGTEVRSGQLTWSAHGYQASILLDDAPLTDAIKENRSYRLVVRKGGRAFCENIVFTGLPALSISVEQETSYIFDKGLPAGTLTLISPTKTGMNVTQCYATYRLRGNLSSTLPKTPYRVMLYNPDGERYFTPLLGLPESDEWILNAMYSEPSRVRDKLALDIWNRMAQTNPSHDLPTASFSYVELFLNDRYMGVYGLMNPVSGTGLKLSEEDVLVKASEWGSPSASRLRTVADTLDGGSTGVAIKWPRMGSDPALWTDIIDFVATYHDKEESADSFSLERFDYENLIDYALFYLVTTPRDNYFANTYYLSRMGADGERRFSRIPWDLNCTFGNCVTGTTRTHCKQNFDIAQDTMLPTDVEQLLKSDTEGNLFQDMASRYQELRKTVLSEDALLNELHENAALLAESGAMERECHHWPEGDQQPDVEPIATFLTEHLAVLDAWFSET